MIIEFYEVNWFGKPNGSMWGNYELPNVPQKGDGITLPDYRKIDHYFRVVKHHYHPAENLVCVGLRLVGHGIAPNTVSSGQRGFSRSQSLSTPEVLSASEGE